MTIVVYSEKTEREKSFPFMEKGLPLQISIFAHQEELLWVPVLVQALVQAKGWALEQL